MLWAHACFPFVTAASLFRTGEHTFRSSSDSRFLRSPTHILPYRTGYLRRVPKAAPGVPWRSDSSDSGSSETEHRGKATPASKGS